jgi:hypothetical protein
MKPVDKKLKYQVCDFLYPSVLQRNWYSWNLLLLSLKFYGFAIKNYRYICTQVDKLLQLSAAGAQAGTGAFDPNPITTLL